MQPDFTPAVRILNWTPVQWARAVRAVSVVVRLPAPNVAGAVHVQRLWQSMYDDHQDVFAAGDDLLGIWGWVYLMFAHAALNPEYLQRFSRKT